MSGLFGFFSAGGDVAEAAVKRMGARMRHSARQVVETAAAGQLGAIGRIGIGIFNPEPQPVSGAGGAVLMWLCGELYYQEQRRAQLVASGALAPEASDAALALQVYLTGGAPALAGLEGMFVIAVWDGRSGELLLVNDRHGLYPHYYAHAGGGLAFAPEIKGVLCAPRVPRTLDMTAIAQYTRFQQLLGERTWFEGVRRLPAASIMRYAPAEDRLTLARYWDWDAITPLPRISFDEAVEECVRLFQRAIDAMTAPPRRVGIYLSGGLDGRTILGFIDRSIPVTTLSFGQAGCLDVTYAAALARRAGSRHHWFPLEDGSWVREHAGRHLALTEGLHSWMHAHGISTLDTARQLIDVNLTGWDGGTTLGARLDEYETDAALRHAPTEAELTERLYHAFCRTFTWPGLTDQEADALFCEPARMNGLARESFGEELGRTAHYPPPWRSDFFYIDQHVLRSTHNMIVFARSAIEVRCPFFDYSLISFLYALPEQIRATARFHHAVLTRRSPHLALVPHEKTNRLPHSNLALVYSHAALQKAKRVIGRTLGLNVQQRTRVYADYERYLRTDLREWAEGILFDRRTLDRGLFNPGAVRDLWERHQRGVEHWTIGKIAHLITIEQVIRTLYEEETAGAPVLEAAV